MAITLLELVDTFSTLVTRLNEVITKTNNINVDSSTATLKLSTGAITEPQDADIDSNTGTLYFTSTGVLKYKYKIGSNTPVTKEITVGVPSL